MRKRVLCMMLLTCGLTFALTGCAGTKKNPAPISEPENITEVPATKAPEPTAEPTVEPTPEPTKVPTRIPTPTPSPIPKKPMVEKETGFVLTTDATATHSVHIEGFLNENFGVTVGYAGASFYTTDGGKSWVEGTNKSMCRFALDILNKDFIVSAGNGNDLRISKDQGATWMEGSDTKGLTSTNTGVSFCDEMNGWVCTINQLIATSDGAVTWTKLTLPKDIKRIAAINLRTKNDGYILATNGLLYVTKDGGTSFSVKNLSFSTYDMINVSSKKSELKMENLATADLTFFDEKNGKAAFINTLADKSQQVWVLTTSDGGDNWVSEQIPIEPGFEPSRMFLSNDGKYLTMGSGRRMLVYRDDAK